MATIEHIQELVASIGLPYYRVINESGAHVEDAFGIVGFSTLKEMELTLEVIDNVAGVAAVPQLFQKCKEEDCMMMLGDLAEATKKLTGEKVPAAELTFTIDNEYYLPGILVTPNL